MFSANVFLVEYDFPPKNGPVPSQPMNGYQNRNQQLRLYAGGLQAVSQSDRQQREVYYAGRVQGVGFRYTVRSLAAGFNVTGFVRNLPDGRVHLTVEGAAEEVDALLDAIKAEMAYYIKDIQELVRPATGRFPSFEIRH
jgi:acylphosphatase